METTIDKFLGGRIECAQPKKGFRAGHDTVLLAAAVPAKAGDVMLELGSGAGIASLCLAARVPGVSITGIDIDEAIVALANENAARNCMSDRVRFVNDDATKPSIPKAGCNHVFFNPPFHPGTGDVSPSAAKDRATRSDDIALWWRKAVELVKDGGTVTAILRADRVEELTGAGGQGALTILPLSPREGEPAKRAIVQLRKGTSESSRTLAPMILHQPDGKPTAAAEAALRHAKPILL